MSRNNSSSLHNISINSTSNSNKLFESFTAFRPPIHEPYFGMNKENMRSNHHIYSKASDGDSSLLKSSSRTNSASVLVVKAL